MSIDLKASVLGSIIELANSANNPEINPCLEEAKPADCDFADCPNCPFEVNNAKLLKSKTDYLLSTAIVLGADLDTTLDALLAGQEANENMDNCSS